MEDMDATLKAMRAGTLVPQMYNSQDQIEGACQAGKIFACKGHRSLWVIIGGYLIVGIISTLIGILSPGSPMIFLGLLLVVCGVLFWAIYRIRVFLVGSVGIFMRRLITRIFVPWDQILNVENQKKRYNNGIKFTTIGGMLNFTITNDLYSPIDTLPSDGIQGLYELINTYFQMSRSHRPTSPLSPVPPQ